MPRIAVVLAALALSALPAAAKDALMAYTDVHHPQGRPYTTRRLALLPTPAGAARLVGYENSDQAAHYAWGTVWYLVTPQGRLYELPKLTEPGGQPFAAKVDEHDAVAIHFGTMFQGTGLEAYVRVYAVGNRYRFHREEHTYDSYSEPTTRGEVKTTDGALALKPAPAKLIASVPGVKEFPALGPVPTDRDETSW